MTIVVALGLGALFLFNGNITMGTGLDRDPKTWIVEPGETLRVLADHVTASCEPGPPGNL